MKHRKRRTSTALPAGIAHLRACFAAHDLVLFLGAGVSLSAGMPGWEALLHQLTVAMWQERLEAQAPGEDAETFATLFREAFGGFPIISGRFIRHAFADRFQERVRAILYAQPAPTSELLRAITRLCAAPHALGCIDAIVSYNYDDLVERHMAARGVRFRSIYAEGQSPRTDELPIYHVHGYLPADGSNARGSEIVFAEDAYHTQFLDPYGWANITQLNLLRERTGLFLGLSMTDPNLRRLLDVAHRHSPDRRHYVVLRSPTPDEMECRTTVKKERDRLEAFTRAFQSIQEDALTDLGLSVLWVDSYEQVPLLLNQIRKARWQQA